MGRKNPISQMWVDCYSELRAYAEEAIREANEDNFKRYYNGLEFRMNQIEKYLVNRCTTVLDSRLLLYMFVAATESQAALMRKINKRDVWNVDWSTCEKIISEKKN